MPLDLPGFLRRPAVRVMEMARRTDSLKLLPELLESQWWSPEKLDGLQRRRMEEQGRWCREKVPFWREAFERAGIGPGEPLSPESIRRLPLLDKQTIREAGAAMRAVDFESWQPRHKNTSGSTGVPLDYYIDRPAHSFQWAHMWRGWAQTGYLPGDRYAAISGGSLVPEKVGLKQMAYLALSGALHFPTYHLTPSFMDGVLAQLRRKSIAFLYGYPSSLEIFGEHMLEKGIELPPMKAVFTTSEQLWPKARKTIGDAFGCRVVDTYGCNDGGIFSFECELNDGLHLGTESVYVEVVDEEGNPVPDGETGQIVATNLVIRAMPLLRFMTGDIGALTREPCACGRGLMRVVKLQGRDRDVIRTPSGRKIHGAFFTHFEAIHRADWMRRFQLYQPDLRTLVIRVKTWRDPSEAERRALLDGMRAGLGEMDFRIEEVDEMELTRTGKFRVILSDLE